MVEYLFVYGSLMMDIESNIATFLKEHGNFVGEAYVTYKFSLATLGGLHGNSRGLTK